MQPKLPSELYEGILCHLTSTTDLYNLLFVSRFTAHEAERLLYRAISLHDSNVVETFAKCICGSPGADLVRRLEIRTNDQVYDESCLRALRAALRHLKYLKQFTFDGSLTCNTYDETPTTIFVLEDATTSLESLVFGSIDSEHIHLLNKQTQLKELVMENGGALWDTKAFPLVTIAGCPGQLVEKCLDTSGVSKISRFRLTHGVPFSHSSPFTHIRSIDVCLFTVDADVFSRIVCKFPSLEYLRCTIKPYGFMVSGQH